MLSLDLGVFHRMKIPVANQVTLFAWCMAASYNRWPCVFQLPWWGDWGSHQCPNADLLPCFAVTGFTGAVTKNHWWVHRGSPAARGSLSTTAGPLALWLRGDKRLVLLWHLRRELLVFYYVMLKMFVVTTEVIETFCFNLGYVKKNELY